MLAQQGGGHPLRASYPTACFRLAGCRERHSSSPMSCQRKKQPKVRKLSHASAHAITRQKIVRTGADSLPARQARTRPMATAAATFRPLSNAQPLASLSRTHLTRWTSSRRVEALRCSVPMGCGTWRQRDPWVGEQLWPPAARCLQHTLHADARRDGTGAGNSHPTSSDSARTRAQGKQGREAVPPRTQAQPNGTLSNTGVHRSRWVCPLHAFRSPSRHSGKPRPLNVHTPLLTPVPFSPFR
jgi:hypothetical protein